MVRRKHRLPRPANCRFDERAADRAVNFFRSELIHGGSGGRRWIGKPFEPTPDQEHDIREIFGRVDEDGNRVVRQVFAEIPKKNGKSELAAGVALKLLYADSEPGAEIYGAASDITQAGIVFSVAASMVRHNPRLLQRSRIWDSTKRIVVPGSESFYRAVTSKVAGKHGFNSHGVIFDEAHTQSDMLLWDVLTFGSGSARAQPLTLAITTAGIPGESPVAEMLHGEADQILRGIVPCPEHFYPVMYSAEDGDPWDSEDVWYECNPFLRDGIMHIEDVRKEFDDARRRPDQQNTFRRLRLNQWVAQEVRVIDMDQWDGCAGPINLRELKHLTWYGGIDLSTRLDLTALVLCATDGNGILHVIPNFWLPSENLKDRPNIEYHKYRPWSERGLIELTPGNTVDFARVRQKLLEYRDQVGLQIAEVAFDQAFALQLSQMLIEDGFTMVNFAQAGFRRWHEPFDDLLGLIEEHRIRHGGHPILRWNADCLSAKQSADGMLRPVKPERKKSAKRIDGMVALIMAHARNLVGDSGVQSAWAGAEKIVI